MLTEPSARGQTPGGLPCRGRGTRLRQVNPTPVSILILRCGHTEDAVAAVHGDYDRWFIQRMEGLGCRFTVHHVPTGGVPPVSGYDGILITGTAAGVMDQEPWMAGLRRLLAEADGPGPPVLAVCFGAQLAAAAGGGLVERNPRGWEIGTVEIRLTEAGRHDPLFAGLPSPFAVQSTHQDHMARLPADAALLASNEMATVQAFARGRIRGVQFHPEAGPEIIRVLVGMRHEMLQEDARTHKGLSPAEARRRVEGIRAGLRPTGNGRRILENWIRHHVRGEPVTA